MRPTAAGLAILVATFGFLQLLPGRGDFFALSVLLYSVALVVSAIAAFRGGPLIYLATSWGLYLGLNLAAYADVVYASSQKSDPISIFISIVLGALPLLAFDWLGTDTVGVSQGKTNLMQLHLSTRPEMDKRTSTCLTPPSPSRWCDAGLCRCCWRES